MADKLSQQRKSLILRYMAADAEELDSWPDEVLGVDADLEDAPTVVAAPEPPVARLPAARVPPSRSPVPALPRRERATAPARRRRRSGFARRRVWAEHTTIVWCAVGATVAIVLGLLIPHL